METCGKNKIGSAKHMKVKKIIVNNYRLLKDFTIDLEDDLSLVIGKNNCGKTSFLSLLEKFLVNDSDNFSFEDFNLEYQQELKDDIIKDTVPDDYNFNLQLRNLYPLRQERREPEEYLFADAEPESERQRGSDFIRVFHAIPGLLASEGRLPNL